MQNLSVIFLTFVFVMCFQNSIGQVQSEFLKDPPDKNNSEILTLQEVDSGKTATLYCNSNDKAHIFLFWQLAEDDVVVGPGNKYDDFKYDYEILSGNLIIRSVSTQEEGVYHCVSRGVSKDDIHVRSVRMVVKRDWDEVEAHDPGVNYFRGVVVVGSLMVIAGALYFAYRLKKRHRLQGLLDASSDDEDSADEIFRAPGTSRGTTGNIVLDNADDDSIDNPKISIDFEDILNNSKK